MPPIIPPDPSRPRIRSRPDPVGRRSLTNEVLTETLQQDAARIRRTVRTGAHWFYWVAALSLINSVVFLFGGGISFLAGLAVTQILDGVSAHLGMFGPYFNLGLDLVLAFFVCGFGYLAARGSKTALIVGMVLYALDGAIFLLVSAFAPALFHAFVLYQIYKGWLARRELDELMTNSPTLQATAAPETRVSPPET